MVKQIYSGVVTADLERARAWYATVFGRDADTNPMSGLYEWHVGECVLQLVDIGKVREIQNLPDWGAKGASSVTLVVDDIKAITANLTPVSHFDGPAFSTTSVRDIDGNLVTLLQPAVKR